jgi:hypothetical protein
MDEFIEDKDEEELKEVLNRKKLSSFELDKLMNGI